MTAREEVEMGAQCDWCGAPVMDNGKGATIHVELADVIFCNLAMAQPPVSRAMACGGCGEILPPPTHVCPPRGA